MIFQAPRARLIPAWGSAPGKPIFERISAEGAFQLSSVELKRAFSAFPVFYRNLGRCPALMNDAVGVGATAAWETTGTVG